VELENYLTTVVGNLVILILIIILVNTIKNKIEDLKAKRRAKRITINKPISKTRLF
jgi:uncharacterized membrane protein